MSKRVVRVPALVTTSAFEAPKTTERKMDLRPALACKDKWTRIAAIGALEAFRDAYRVARKAFARREFDVVFPAGSGSILCGRRVAAA